jgi:hypothetical protein
MYPWWQGYKGSITKINSTSFETKGCWEIKDNKLIITELPIGEATANYKVNAGGDFPSPFLDYKKKGYKVELLGKETVDGSETFKIKLTKKPIKVDGKETENVEFHYFDTENFVPLIVENEVKSGPGKGAVLQNKLSDYQDAGGFLFPFSISIGAKGQPGGQNLVYTAVELNPKVEASAFAFPEGK